MKIAIVCDYLNVYGGAERTLESVLEIYPKAQVFTSIFDPSKFRPESPIRKARVHTVLPAYFLIFTSYFLKHITFVMPYFFERLDLSAFDLIISLGTIWSKGVKTESGRQKHIFYCLTPPRFLYKYPSATSKRNVWYYRPFTTILDHWLRIWDFNAAQKPTQIISISEEVQRRVKKFYRRDSVVIYPPVESGIKNQEAKIKKDREYYLIVSRLAAYKGIDVAIKACNELKLPLKIVGTGREGSSLKALSGPTIEFLGFRSDDEINELYKGAKALIFPTPDEDFGIVPLEANAHGVSVIAHRSGGPLETLVEGKTGVYFEGLDGLKHLLAGFNESIFSSEGCIQNAGRFSREIFKDEFSKEVLSCLEKSTGTLTS
jgi:glycosyltransferase involved in cell wall biosynthesis